MRTFTKARISACYFALMIVFLATSGLFMKDLNLGLDFTGGQLTEFKTSSGVSKSEMQQALNHFNLNSSRITASSDTTRWTLRLQDVPNQTVDLNILATLLSTDQNIEIIPLDSVYIGSQVGTDMLEQGGLALLVSGIAIILYLSVRFEWRQGLGALAALAHDVLIVLGIFSWFNLSFDLTVLAAILAIIGYSLNDSIVVGDRIRELLQTKSKASIDDTINLAVKSTLTRTLITSGTTLATIGSIYLLAGEALKGFSLALFIGVIAGSLSSISLSATLPSMFGLDANFYIRQAESINSEGEV